MAPQLRKVERDIIIPRYIEYKINHELCNDESRIFAQCARESRLRVVIDCRDAMKKFAECSNKWFKDEELRKQVEQEYLTRRQHFRKTGEPLEKSPFKRF